MGNNREIGRSVLVAFLLIVCFILFDIFILGPGTFLYRRNVDIDVNSGQLRNRYYYWVIPVRKETVSTEFSKLVSRHLEKPKDVQWKEDINTVTLGLGMIRRGGYIISNCCGLANAIFVAEYEGTLTEEEKVSYLKKAMAAIKEGRHLHIRDMADEIIKKEVVYGH